MTTASPPVGCHRRPRPERHERGLGMRLRLLLVAPTLIFASSCGSAKPAVDYAAVTAACTTLKQAILDAHGDDATAQDEIDFVAVRAACGRRLADLDTEDAGQ